MNIRSLTGQPPEPTPGAAMMVNISKREATPTKWIADLEAEVLALASEVTQVTNAAEQERAVWVQASLARYIRAVQNSEAKAKEPLNLLRKKILDLSKTLIEKVDNEGARLGGLVADFHLAETRRLGALRRLQDEQASALTREMDSKLAVAPSVDEQEAIKEEYRDRIAEEAKVVPEPARAEGQRITENWEITVVDAVALFRSHSHCCKIVPILTEIKGLLNEGVEVKGVLAKKVTNSGVVLPPDRRVIDV